MLFSAGACIAGGWGIGLCNPGSVSSSYPAPFKALKQPEYHLMQIIRDSIEVHWGGEGVVTAS